MPYKNVKHCAPVIRGRYLVMLQVAVLNPQYRKNSKIWDTSNNCQNCLKNRKV